MPVGDSHPPVSSMYYAFHLSLDHITLPRDSALVPRSSSAWRHPQPKMG